MFKVFLVVLFYFLSVEFVFLNRFRHLFYLIQDKPNNPNIPVILNISNIYYIHKKKIHENTQKVIYNNEITLKHLKNI